MLVVLCFCCCLSRLLGFVFMLSSCRSHS
jgi:hypothetical protein